MHKINYYFILILATHSLSAQEKVSSHGITNNITEQLNIYPKEKIHLHIDRSCYLPGDTLWFKAYMVNASSHTSINLSRYVYVELVNPEDETVDRVKIRPNANNQFHGYIPIPENISGGSYALLAYTRYMLTEEKQHLFKREICIALAGNWETVQLKTTILPPQEKNTQVQLELRDGKQKQIPLKKVIVTCSEGKSASAKLNKEKKIDLRIQNEKMVSNACMRIDMTDIRNNTYRQYAAISTGTEDYDVTFYPEGGALLAETPCRMAYKVLDISGNSIEATLKLINEQGNTIVESETQHSGMGAFTFTPEKGKRYSIQALNKQGVKKNFELPQIQEYAYGITLKDRKENIQLSVNSAIHAPIEELLLLINVRGRIIHTQWLSSDKGEIITIEKKKFPPGIVQCLLLDKNYSVLSERLGFIPYRKAVVCNVKNDKNSYGKRELIRTSLSLTDVSGNPVNGNLSIAITDKSMAVADTTHSILSTLLLSSDLKGRIETPAFYLQENLEAVKALDLLLMTHGWKRYWLPEIMKGNFEKPAIEPERFTSLSGRFKSKSGFGDKDCIDIYIRNLELGLNKEMKSGAGRTFRLDSLEFAEGTSIGIIGKRFIRKGEKYGLNQTGAILDREESFHINEKTVPQPVLSKVSGGIQWDIIYPAGANHYFLKPVTIKSGVLNMNLNKKEIAKLKFKNVWELVEHLGAKFIYPFPTKVIERKDRGKRIFKTSSWMCSYKNMPLILIVNGKLLRMAAEIFNYLSLSDIREIHLYSVDKKEVSPYWKLPDDFFEYAQVAILKLTIHPDVNLNHLIYLSSIERKIKAYGKLDIQTDVYPSGGYQELAAFYSPKYEKGSNDDVFIPDFRSLFYWNPALQTDSLGKCDFSFYSADKATTYKMVIEGVTEKGEMVYEIREFEIK